MGIKKDKKCKKCCKKICKETEDINPNEPMLKEVVVFEDESAVIIQDISTENLK